MASRERKRRKDLRSKLERHVAAEGYKPGDSFPELGSGGTSGSRRRKMPAKFRNPQNPDETWTGIGRFPILYHQSRPTPEGRIHAKQEGFV